MSQKPTLIFCDTSGCIINLKNHDSSGYNKHNRSAYHAWSSTGKFLDISQDVREFPLDAWVQVPGQQIGGFRLKDTDIITNSVIMPA